MTPTTRTLEGVCANLLTWAIGVGHDARQSVVPRWARPIMTTAAAVVNHPLVLANAQATMFDIPTVEKKSRSKAKKHHRFEKPQGA